VRIDLDHNATTRLDPRAAEAMRAALELHGNPSSIHEEGRRARDAVERARDEVAALLGAARTEIVFTSGGTEAIALGLLGLARAARAAGRPARVVTSPLEHPAVRGAVAALEAEGFAAARVAVDAAGRIDPADVARALAGGAAVASFALAQNELGNLYDVAGLARAARAAGAVFLCDAVQAVGKVPVDVAALGVDALALSAHKIHGPKGAGALWLRGDAPFAPPLAGHQEKGLRPGTENVAAIVGFGVAARTARPGDAAGQAALRDRLEAAALAIPGARRHGDPERRVPNTTSLAFAGVPGDILVAALDLEGVAASTGSACTSGTVEPSAVILALGVARAPAAEAVRFSLGRDTRPEDIERVAALLPRLVARIRDSLG
jgi:cysteine desulfurase